jgi:hypothetical protein
MFYIGMGQMILGQSCEIIIINPYPANVENKVSS